MSNINLTICLYCGNSISKILLKEFSGNYNSKSKFSNNDTARKTTILGIPVYFGNEKKWMCIHELFSMQKGYLVTLFSSFLESLDNYFFTLRRWDCQGGWGIMGIVVKQRVIGLQFPTAVPNTANRDECWVLQSINI